MPLSRAARERVLPDEGEFAELPLNSLIHPIPGVATWIWDATQDHAAYADEWRELLGLPAEQPLGETIAWLLERIRADDRAAFREACIACAEGQTNGLEMSIRLECHSGTQRWALVRCVAVDADAGQRRLVSGIAIEISRWSADGRFISSAARRAPVCRVTLENSPDFIIYFNRQLHPLYINPVAAGYLALLPGQPIGDTCEELGICPQGKAFFHQHITAVFETGKGTRATASFPDKQGGEISGEFCFWPEFDEEGTVVSVACHMSDITETIRAERELRQNEQRFSAMYQLAQMLEKPEEEIIRFVVEQIALLTQSQHSYFYLPDFRENGESCMFWSKSLYAQFGSDKLPSDRIPSDCFTQKCPCPTSLRSAIIHNHDEEHGVHVSFGSLAIRRYMTVPAFDEGRLVGIASVCNKDSEYTELDLKQLELFVHGAWLTLRRRRFVDDLRKAKESAERANRVKDEFLANISHELRTPLNGILSMLQLMELAPLSEDLLEYVRTASLSGKSLLRIISDILDFSRMESGKMSLQTSPFDLRSTLNSTMSLFAGEARQRGLTLSVSIDEALPPLLLGDDARVRQILFNLTGNALKFTERGGISVECCLLPYRTRNKVWIYFSIADTGVGIPPEAHSAIFESFTQVGNKVGKYSGTGLGLSIVKQLVLHMGGSLTVDSQEGEGTVIHCSLPFALPPASAHASRLRPGEPERPFRCLNILVAEDDPVGRFAIRTFLARMGHCTVCVDTGRQALEALRLYPFDCLITDIQMPDMDGLEVARRIRQGTFDDVLPSGEVVELVRRCLPETGDTPGDIPSSLTIVAFTAHAMRGDREHFLRMGMDLYLSKPIILEELQKVLQQILHRTGAR